MVSSVFCLPELGKPNPAEIKPEGRDTRGRVVQHGSKYNCCWYYVFNILRDRIKAPNTEESDKRKFELLASARRKEVSKHEESLPDVADQLNDATVKRMFSAITLAKGPQSAALILKGLPHLKPSMDAFFVQEEQKTYYDYLTHLKMFGRTKINENFLEKVGTTFSALFSEAYPKNPEAFGHFCIGGTSWDQLQDTEKKMLADQLVSSLSAERYGLKISSWHPSQPIERLIDQLNEHGSHSVSGCFGKPHYKCDARELGQKIGERKVFGWRPQDPRKEGHITGHVILIVGAEKAASGKEFVYYIDPMDESDPANPDKQKIYKMSYRRLIDKDSITDTFGFVGNTSPAAVGYAYHA
ncbi:MAG: hypothetical protein P0S94_00685 [Simkaniaceae bacterium]|nr:hypothetical protein [Simkaniaceae bacterium]